MIDSIRERRDSKLTKTIGFVVLFLVLGALAGIGSKYLDTLAFNTIPQLMQLLDFSNFLGRPAVWLFIALLISCLAGSPFRAAWYVLAFFVGMVGCYYFYSYYVAGFYPQDYARIWYALTALSPALAFICWFAKGEGIPSIILSSCILAVMINLTFSYGAIYVHLNGILELLLLSGTLMVLKRRQIAAMAVLGLAIAIAIHTLPLPIHIW